jgi:uncharacterized protein YcnI
MYARTFLAAAVLTLATGTASAHVTLETGQAPAGSSYKAVFRVPHGCDGKPTIAVRVKIPEGFIGAKPMPKPGWTLDKVKGKYAKAYKLFGADVMEGLTEVSWSGGSLPDDEYDEFVLRGTFAGDLSAGTVIYFPVVQECPDGAAERWIEMPAAGQSADDLEKPAPSVTLTEKTGGH